jgi:folate-dependent phosphoribosylglycinamide formyltransferase PurN
VTDRLRTVLLSRGGPDAKHLAAVLNAAGLLDAIVIEDSGAARRGKLAQSFKGVPFWAIPTKALQVFSLVMYGNWSAKVLDRGLGVADFPADVSQIEIGNANDAASIAVLKDLRPDVLIVLGTGILRDEVIAIPALHALNIHGGAVPEYRGVYSDFWTLANDDPGAVCSTIFHIDSGVDTGPVALTGHVQMQPWPSLAEVKIANSRLRAQLMVRALEEARAGTLPRIPQQRERARTWYTPSALQLTSGLWRIRRSRIRAARLSPSPSRPARTAD